MFFENGNIHGNYASIWEKNHKFEAHFTKVCGNAEIANGKKTFKVYDNAVKHLRRLGYRFIDLEAIEKIA